MEHEGVGITVCTFKKPELQSTYTVEPL